MSFYKGKKISFSQTWHFSFCEPLSLSLYPSIFLYVENTQWFQQPLGDISDPCDAHCPLGYEVWRGAWYPLGRVQDVLGSWRSSGIPWPHFIALPHFPPPPPTQRYLAFQETWLFHTLHVTHWAHHQAHKSEILIRCTKKSKGKGLGSLKSEGNNDFPLFTLSLGIYDYTGKIILLSSDTKRQSIQTLMCPP